MCSPLNTHRKCKAHGKQPRRDRSVKEGKEAIAPTSNKHPGQPCPWQGRGLHVGFLGLGCGKRLPSCFPQGFKPASKSWFHLSFSPDILLSPNWQGWGKDGYFDSRDTYISDVCGLLRTFSLLTLSLEPQRGRWTVAWAGDPRRSQEPEVSFQRQFDAPAVQIALPVIFCSHPRQPTNQGLRKI